MKKKQQQGAHARVRQRAVGGLLVVAFAMSACGGEDQPASFGTPEGLWHGATGFGKSLNGLVLDDGTFWFMYSAAGNASVMAGFVQSNSHSGVETFSTWDSVDFNLEGSGISINGVIAGGGYIPQATMDGFINFRLQLPDSFSATYDVDYSLTPSLATLAGTYSGSAATQGGTEFATVTVAETGAISGSSASGCIYAGTAAPRATGNVYNFSITFAGSPCFNGTATVTGVAYLQGTELIAMALNADRTSGVVAELTR
jgi:hypothetical protein